jgi:hypothetical protein
MEAARDAGGFVFGNVEKGSGGLERWYRAGASGYPYPGCFAERVRSCLIAKELSFLSTTKTLQQCVRKGVSQGRAASGEWREKQSAE